MGLPWNVNKPFHELALKLERGIEDLRVLRDDGRLKQTLLIEDSMLYIIEQIMDTGKSDYLRNILARIPSEHTEEQKIGIPSDEVIE